jgi:DnaJ-domain-containing protein 1
MDYFKLLGEPRRPWLDDQFLKDKFLALSAEAHPDRMHGGSAEERAQAHDRSAELNAAYNCLREPKDRLLHLLELESGVRPGDVQQIPVDLMNLFAEAAQLLGKAEAFLRARAKAASPLLKARMFEQGSELAAQLQALGGRINSRRDPLLAELKEMNAGWESAPAPVGPGRAAALPLRRLEEIYRQLSYFNRWTAQLQERALEISFR